MMRFMGAVLFGAALSTTVCCAIVYGFETDTHILITTSAFQRSVLTNGFLERELGLSVDAPIRSAENLSLPARRWFEQGSEREDDANFISPAPLRFRHHFYDPVYNRGLTGPALGTVGRRAFEWALEEPESIAGQDYSWRDARGYFLSGLTAETDTNRQAAMATTFRALGQVVHLIQDMAVPEHTRNDWHAGVLELFGFPLGTPSLFEGHIRALGNSNLLTLDGYGSVSFPILRYYWTTGDGRGLAEFTNRSFVSKDTNFSQLLDGDVGRDNFRQPYPAPVLSLARRFEVDVAAPDAPGCASAPGLTGKVSYFGNAITGFVSGGPSIENKYMTAVSVFDAALASRGKPRLFTIDFCTIEAAAAILLPRATAYSAALIDHFFRGRVEFDLVVSDEDPTRADLVVVNRSRLGDTAEPLGPGTLSLYADDATGARSPMAGATVSLTSPLSTDTLSPVTTFAPPPSDAKRLTLAIQGTLGQEMGAVVGKVMEVPALEQIYWDTLFITGDYVYPWFLRTPDGVFLLPFEDFVPAGHVVDQARWGERDNILAAQSRNPNDPTDIAFTVLKIARAEGSPSVPTMSQSRYGFAVVVFSTGPDDVKTVRLTSVFGMDLGTTVTVNHTHRLRQFLVSFVDELDYGPPGTIATSTVSDPVLDLLDVANLSYTESFRLRLNREQYGSSCTDLPCPYFSWWWDDFSVTASGDVVLTVNVSEGLLPLASTQREVPALGHRADGSVGPIGGPFAVELGFPDDAPYPDFGKLRFITWVNLSQGTVVAKTMADAVTLSESSTEDALRAEVHFITRDQGQTIEDAWVVQGITGCGDTGYLDVALDQGILSLGYSGLYRDDLRALGLETDFGIQTTTQVLPYCIGSARVTRRLFAPGPFPYALAQIGTTVLPGSQGLTRPIVLARRSGDESQLVLWDGPLARTTRRLAQQGVPFGGVTANQRWALIDDFPAGF